MVVSTSSPTYPGNQRVSTGLLTALGKRGAIANRDWNVDELGNALDKKSFTAASGSK
jgi:hypothetical protein